MKTFVWQRLNREGCTPVKQEEQPAGKRKDQSPGFRCRNESPGGGKALADRHIRHVHREHEIREQGNGSAALIVFIPEYFFFKPVHITRDVRGKRNSHVGGIQTKVADCDRTGSRSGRAACIEVNITGIVARESETGAGGQKIDLPDGFASVVDEIKSHESLESVGFCKVEAKRKSSERG